MLAKPDSNAAYSAKMGGMTVNGTVSQAVRRSMQANRSRDTKPELVVRKLIHARGLRYRVAYRAIPTLRRTVDIAFTRAKVAVFIDGCFWHGCPDHYQRPNSNRLYWDAKVIQNRERDAETARAFEANGWTVLRFWEHEVRSDPQAVANGIIDAVRRRPACGAEHSSYPVV